MGEWCSSITLQTLFPVAILYKTMEIFILPVRQAHFSPRFGISTASLNSPQLSINSRSTLSIRKPPLVAVAEPWESRTDRCTISVDSTQLIVREVVLIILITRTIVMIIELFKRFLHKEGRQRRSSHLHHFPI